MITLHFGYDLKLWALAVYAGEVDDAQGYFTLGISVGPFFVEISL